MGTGICRRCSCYWVTPCINKRRIDMDKEDVELFNAAFLGLGIVLVIVVALIAFQPDGYQRFLKFIEITSEDFKKFSNIMNGLLSFMSDLVS